MTEPVNVILKTGKEQSVRRYHPWIFSGAINIIEGNPKEGDIVRVIDHQHNFLCIGHYQPGSIAVRIISFENNIPDYKFWKNRIENAFNFRKEIGLVDCEATNVFRLVNAEGDNLPGLVIDFYNGTAVIQVHTVGMYNILEYLIKALKEVLGKRLNAIYDKSEDTLPHKANIKSENGYLFGSSLTNIVLENNNKFIVNWEEGQKTGFFIDQRENRRLVSGFAKDRKVLNLFGYTGAFSVYALCGGAEFVHTIDSSAKAIELANKNVELNGGKDSNHQAFILDAMDYLGTTDEKYNLIIIDPPAFAKRQNVLKMHYRHTSG